MSDKSSRRIVGYSKVVCNPTLLPGKVQKELKRGWEPHGPPMQAAGGDILQYLIRRECNLPDWHDAWNSTPENFVPVSLDQDDVVDVLCFGHEEGEYGVRVSDIPVEKWEHIARWRYSE